jgi:hypothetical protein
VSITEPATDVEPPRPTLTAVQRRIIGVVAAGAVVIAAIGFAGSYSAVQQLAHDKGFGWFSNVFPIGVDAGIGVLLALDLLLTWLRIPFPLLRHIAWLLTAATIAFNGAAAWPDPLAVGMHGTIPILFVAIVEAARHATGRIADITADRHMEGVRLSRWLLAPIPTFWLWRRMKMWELRSYNEVIRLEQERLIYRARLRAQYGRNWRRKAPVEAVLKLRLTRFGASLDQAAALEASTALDAPAALEAPAAFEAPAALEAPRRIICGASLGELTVPPRITAALEAPRRHVICGASLGPLTVPPRITAAPKRLTPAARPAAASPKNDAPVKPAGQRSEAPEQRPAAAAAASASFDHHTADALRLVGMSKAAAVRTIHEAHPEDAAPQIVERLAGHGIAATASYVRTELSRHRKRLTASSEAASSDAASSGIGQYL